VADTNKAFVAYPSRDARLSHTISIGVGKANARVKHLRYFPWEFNDIAGAPVISPILEGIQESLFIVADITYLNPNVVYEVGFAIGSRKRAYLVRNTEIEGDRKLARSAGIFDTLGYEEYADDEALAHKLSSHIDPSAQPFSLVLDRLAPVYLVEPPIHQRRNCRTDVITTEEGALQIP